MISCLIFQHTLFWYCGKECFLVLFILHKLHYSQTILHTCTLYLFNTTFQNDRWLVFASRYSALIFNIEQIWKKHVDFLSVSLNKNNNLGNWFKWLSFYLQYVLTLFKYYISVIIIYGEAVQLNNGTSWLVAERSETNRTDCSWSEISHKHFRHLVFETFTSFK